MLFQVAVCLRYCCVVSGSCVSTVLLCCFRWLCVYGIAVLFQVAAYGNAVEPQTLDELRALQSSPDRHKLGIQCMLIGERVLGKQNKATSYIIRHNAAVHADENRFDLTTELIFHGLKNLSDVCPFDSKSYKVDFYGFLVDLLFAGHDIAGPGAVTFSHTLNSLKWALSDFKRGEAEKQQTQSEDFLTKRQNLLRITLHMICLLQQTVKRGTPGERRQLSEAVRTFVQTGVRGQKGDTLLHVACDEGTNVFDTWDEHYEACTFPAPEVVQALLAAGCDVAAQNEAGQTALQVAREQKGDHSEIIRILAAAGCD